MDDGLGLCDGPKALDFMQRVWIGQLVNYMDCVLIKEFNLAHYMFGLDWAISKCREAHGLNSSPSPSPLSVNGIGIGKGLISNQAN